MLSPIRKFLNVSHGLYGFQMTMKWHYSIGTFQSSILHSGDNTVETV